MSSDEATMKRQRVSRACDLCRKKKIKCDGASPLCGNCKAFSLDCSYKDTTKKRGPPKGYIEAIENRLYKLESYLKNVAEQETDPRTIELLKELQAPLETPEGEKIKGKPQRRQRRRPVNQESKTPPTIDSPLSTLLNSPELSHSETLPEESARPSNVTTASTTIVSTPARNDSTGQLSMDENGQVRYLGKSSGFYLLSDSRTYQNGAFHFSGYAHKLQQQQKEQQLQLQQHPKNSRTNSRHSINPLELPPKDLSEHLIQLYLTHFYPVLPLFFKKRLACSLSPLEPISPLLLNAIYAMAARVSSDERVRSDSDSPDTAGDIFFERARCLLDDYYDTPKISTVQALLLMASHQMGAMKAARAWLYSGMAFRMAQDLGLNRNCDHWNISPEERERRKRVFWCCFIVDRVISAIYGRSSNFEERDCDVPFPTVEDDEPIPIAAGSSNSNRPPTGVLEVFTQSIKIAGILGHVLKNIYYAKAKLHTDSQHIDHILTTLHQQLIHWHRNLPESLQYKLPNTQIGEKGPDPPSAICQLHLMYYTTVILLHRSFIPGPTQTQLPTSLPSYKLCESAATSVLDIVNIMLGENHLRYVYNFSVFFVFTAGIIFIKLASSKDANKAFDAKINCNRIMRALDDLETTWMNAARGCNILGELAGLRDIKLECDKYVPRKDAESTPPRCIAVPNSPATMDADDDDDDTETNSENWNATKTINSNITVTQQPQRSVSADNFSNNFPSPVFATPSQVPISSVRHHQNRSASIDQLQLQEQRQQAASYFEQHSNNLKPSMDPFEAPGIIHTSSTSATEEFDPLSTAFWGMPTSLDTDEWNAYFGTQQNQNQQQCGQVPQQSQQLTNLLLSTNQSLHQASSFIFGRSQQLDLPSSPSQSALFGFLDDDNSNNEQQQVYVSSPGSMINEQQPQQPQPQLQQPQQQLQQQQQQPQPQQMTSAPSSTDVLYW